VRPRFNWKLRTRSLALGVRTLVVGIVNVTPDSFSDGGQFLSHQQAVDHALRLLDEGADVLDIGGESTRPGKKQPVIARQELERVLPVITGVLRARPEAVVSVDTYKAEVARGAVASGAEIVNDVSGGQWDPQMLATIGHLHCGCVLMHTRGRPEEWHKLSPLQRYAVLDYVSNGLRDICHSGVAAGIRREHIVLDPGFGFGKSFEENYPLLARFEQLQKIGLPLLSGPSRKSFIGRTLARNGNDAPPNQRLNGTIAAVVASVMKGAHIVRVHDVAPVVEALKVADAVLAAEQ